MADYSHEAILGIKLVTIKGRTYRKAPVTSGPGIKKETETGPKNRKLRERKGLAQIQYACSLEEPCDTMLDYDDAALALDIAEEGGLFTHQMHVPSVFFGNIIGKGGQMVSRLQRETGATIQVPKRGGEHISNSSFRICLALFFCSTRRILVASLFPSFFVAWFVKLSRQTNRAPSCQLAPGSRSSSSRQRTEWPTRTSFQSHSLQSRIRSSSGRMRLWTHTPKVPIQ